MGPTLILVILTTGYKTRSAGTENAFAFLKGLVVSRSAFPVLRSVILNTFRTGQLSRTMKDVLLIMAARSRPASYESIAHAAGCSRRMVAYAIAQAEALGLLERVHHRVRRGRQWMNGKNTYRFIMRAITETLAFPWQRSQCKSRTTGNQENIKTPSFQRSRDEMLAFIASWAAETPPKPVPT